ncbi:hypothetical protein CROQUDRAFT_715132 [Cronartium quercuum f. sp. fusiforme G11]|uniref:Uncharacterized protein n=1 Tax=Cronartium quercuum f. sp. fusiforme G11 TaxID=708437 RepID=A0A9P6NNL6_9BASI|nr:hypothetical protein CROQUDRAFT_715132 [Cronartium quercuum f. sp. fusiforme G11]
MREISTSSRLKHREGESNHPSIHHFTFNPSITLFPVPTAIASLVDMQLAFLNKIAFTFLISHISGQNVSKVQQYNCTDSSSEAQKIVSVDCQFALGKFNTDSSSQNPHIVERSSKLNQTCGSCIVELADLKPKATSLRVSLEKAQDAIESLVVNCSGNPGTYFIKFDANNSTPVVTLSIDYGSDAVCEG